VGIWCGGGEENLSAGNSPKQRAKRGARAQKSVRGNYNWSLLAIWPTPCHFLSFPFFLQLKFSSMIAAENPRKMRKKYLLLNTQKPFIQFLCGQWMDRWMDGMNVYAKIVLLLQICPKYKNKKCHHNEFRESAPSKIGPRICP
jgi:hypothetical protein